MKIMKSITKMVTGLCIALLLSSVTASAKTINVTRPDGDGNITGSLFYAISLAVPGDIIDCSAIAGQTIITLSPGMFVAFNTSNVTLNGSGIVLENPVSVDASYVTIRNVKFQNSTVPFVAVKVGEYAYSSSTVVENCIFTGYTMGACIHFMSAGDYYVRNCIFENNHNSSTMSGIITTGQPGNMRNMYIYGNTFYNNTGGAIFAGSGSNVYVGGNVFYGNTNIAFEALSIKIQWRAAVHEAITSPIKQLP